MALREKTLLVLRTLGGGVVSARLMVPRGVLVLPLSEGEAFLPPF